MPGKSLMERYRGYLTTGEAAGELGLTSRQLRYWLKAGVLPQPTVTRQDGLRLFAPEWLDRAREACRQMETANSQEAKAGGQEQKG